MSKVIGFERDGKIYAIRSKSVKDVPDDVDEAWLLRHSTVVVELASGRVIKNREGPVTARTLTGEPEGKVKLPLLLKKSLSVTDSLSVNGSLTLTDRLLLQSSTRFSFRGEDEDGLGFVVSADIDSPYAPEGWAIVAVEEPGVPGLVLVEAQHGDGYFWMPEEGHGDLDDDAYFTVSIEETERVVLLALEIAQGKVRPKKLKED